MKKFKDLEAQYEVQRQRYKRYKIGYTKARTQEKNLRKELEAIRNKEREENDTLSLEEDQVIERTRDYEPYAQRNKKSFKKDERVLDRYGKPTNRAMFQSKDLSIAKNLERNESSIVNVFDSTEKYEDYLGADQREGHMNHNPDFLLEDEREAPH